MLGLVSTEASLLVVGSLLSVSSHGLFSVHASLVSLL